jgi:hypothetical protein
LLILRGNPPPTHPPGSFDVGPPLTPALLLPITARLLVPPSYRQASLRGIARIFSAILSAVLLALLSALLSLLLAVLLALFSLLLALLLTLLPLLLTILPALLLAVPAPVAGPVALTSGSVTMSAAFSPAAPFPTAFTVLAAVASISPSHAFLLLVDLSTRWRKLYPIEDRRNPLPRA